MCVEISGAVHHSSGWPSSRSRTRNAKQKHKVVLAGGAGATRGPNRAASAWPDWAVDSGRSGRRRRRAREPRSARAAPRPGGFRARGPRPLGALGRRIRRGRLRARRQRDPRRPRSGPRMSGSNRRFQSAIETRWRKHKDVCAAVAGTDLCPTWNFAFQEPSKSKGVFFLFCDHCIISMSPRLAPFFFPPKLGFP